MPAATAVGSFPDCTRLSSPGRCHAAGDANVVQASRSICKPGVGSISQQSGLPITRARARLPRRIPLGKEWSRDAESNPRTSGKTLLLHVRAKCKGLPLVRGVLSQPCFPVPFLCVPGRRHVAPPRQPNCPCKTDSKPGSRSSGSGVSCPISSFCVGDNQTLACHRIAVAAASCQSLQYSS